MPRVIVRETVTVTTLSKTGKPTQVGPVTPRTFDVDRIVTPDFETAGYLVVETRDAYYVFPWSGTAGAVRLCGGSILEFTPEQSSTVERVEYDSANATLAVTFRTGERYRYFGVPDRVVDAMRDSQRPGKFFASMIRAGYRAEKVNPT